MQRKRFAEDIYRDERRYDSLGWSDQKILDQLVKDYGDEAPRMRALRRHLAELRTRDDSGPWSLKEAHPDEIRIVLDYLRDSAEWTFQWPTVTRLEGQWMTKLSKAGPGLSTFILHALAREYIRRYAAEDDSTANPAWDLDAWLAFKAWQPENEEAYNEALQTASLPARSKEEPDARPKRGRPVIPKGVVAPKGALSASFFHALATTKLELVKGGDNGK